MWRRVDGSVNYAYGVNSLPEILYLSPLHTHIAETEYVELNPTTNAVGIPSYLLYIESVAGGVEVTTGIQTKFHQFASPNTKCIRYCEQRITIQ